MEEPDDFGVDSDDLNVPNEDDEDENEEEQQIPRITVQNKSYRLDRINPYLVNLMNEKDKEMYVNICRQLYTEIYEL